MQQHDTITEPNGTLNKRVTWAWASAALIVATIILTGVTFLMQSYRLALQTATDRANAQSFLVSEWINKSFELTKYVLRETAHGFDKDELVYPTNDAAHHHKKTEFMINKVSRTPNMFFLGMLNDRCIVTHTTIGINLGFDAIENDREYCQLALSEPLDQFKISNMFVSVDQTMNVTMSYPLISTEGELEGFALAGLEPSFFQQWLDLIELDHYNSITIYDLNSRMLARNPIAPERIGSQVIETHLNRMASSGTESHFSHRIASPVDGIDRVWSLRRIGELPFIVVVGEPTSTALSNWKHLLYLYLVTGSILCLAILFGTREYVLNLRKALKMQQLATTDYLTGVANRRLFNEIAQRNLSLSSRNGMPLSFIMLDIDHFKRINDRFGHDVGDEVLISLSNLLKKQCRKSDVIARWGGEEFLVLLPDTDVEGALTFSERVAQDMSLVNLPEDHKVTISQGIAVHQAGETLEQTLKRTDTALYRAKELGRDRIELG